MFTTEEIKYSQELFNRAKVDINPYAVVLMLSGGDDSMVTYEMTRTIGIKIDAVIHGHTGCGIEETSIFAQKITEERKDKFIVADAGNAYENYVKRKGFFGKGTGAHKFSYHVLKAEFFRKTISQNFRKGRRGRSILLLNGARRKESANRMVGMINPINKEKKVPNWWVNLINEMSNERISEIVNSPDFCRNPVSRALCRSGECLCGTTQSFEQRAEASAYSPDWGEWIDRLDKYGKEIFGWGWGEAITQEKVREMYGQLNIFKENEMFMCRDCSITDNPNEMP